MQISLAIRVLEEAAFRPAPFPESFTRVAQLLDARTFHMTHDPGFGPPDCIVARDTVSFLEAYLKGDWHHQDIWTQSCRKAYQYSCSDVLTDSTIIDEADRRKSPFFHEFYLDWGIGHVACWNFGVGDEDLGFTIKRPVGRPFSDADVSALRVFKRAANRIGLLVRKFHQQHLVGFLEGLEASGKPSMMLNHLGEVVYVTASAETLIGDGFSINRSIPFGTTVSSEAGFLALRQWARRRGGAVPESFVIQRLSSPHPIIAIPVPIPDDGLLALPNGRAVVMFLDLSKKPEMPKTLLRSMFGLTKREAEVAALLARGDHAENISKNLGLKPASVRQVIKSVMAKADVSRQTELVAMLARFGDFYGTDT